jgi:prepilin-type N-terminal cleavage/methylation domain-containing protein
MKKGFTLIELLVVIAIIGILAALLFPVFSRAKGAANATKAMSNVRQLVVATLLYAESEDDRPPLVTEGPLGAGRTGGYTYAISFEGSTSGPFDPTRGSLFPYATSVGIYGSPADPSVTRSHQSFAFNGCLAEFPPNPGLMATKTIASAAEPSRQFMFAEEQCGSEGTNDGFFHPLWDTLATWHTGRNAMGFIDGHAKITAVDGRYPEVVDAAPTSCWPSNPWAP